MSQGTYNQPPQKSGSNTLTIVLVVVVVIGLLCAGACGACYFAVMSGGKAFAGAIMAAGGVAAMQEHPEVTDELGTPLTAENANFQVNGNTITVDFDVKGPKGTGKGHMEATSSDPNNPQAAKPGVIRVTLPSGKVIDATNPPANTPNIEPPMSPVVDPTGDMPADDATDSDSSDDTP